jgi:hypothetical protein
MPMAAVHPIIQPDTVLMLEHVEHLFGGFLDGYQDGMVELAWTNTKPNPKTGKYDLANGRCFGTDKLDELVAEAAKLNSQPMCNVYIGAWLRKPFTAPFGRTVDADAWAMTASYLDLDDAGATARAKDVYGQIKPTWITMTGTNPHSRAQLWWRLEEPITDHARGEALIRGLTDAMAGDDSICNPGRVMRLAGSLAWATKEGRQLELTFRAPLKIPGQPIYLAEQLERKFPPIAAKPTSIDTGAPAQLTPGIIGKINDGRERYMRDTVLAVLGEYIGQNGCAPSSQELFDIAWPQYEDKTDLTRSGRGREELAEKCQYALKRFEAGRIRGLETLDKAIEVYRRKAEARAAFPRQEQLAPARQDGLIKTADFITLLTEEVGEEPDYIEPGFAGPGMFVLIAGPPKAQKSFLLQEILVAAATGGTFLTDVFKCTKPLRVFYLQAEMNRKLLRKRAREFKLFTAEERKNLATNLIMSERFHMILNEGGVKTAVETINAAFPDAPPDIIAIDPLANVFDQENENDNAQLMRFLTGRIEAVRQQVNPSACVVMVHHATKKSSEDMARDPFVAIRGAGSLRGYYDSAIVIFRAGEESKVRKVHFELRSGESPEPMTVELMNGRFRTVSATSSITKDIARGILREMGAAWERNAPWSPYERSQVEGRYAVLNASKLFNVHPKAAKSLIDEWIFNKVVTFQERLKGKRPAGLQVTGSID